MDERAREIEVLHGRYAGAIYHLCVRMLDDRAEAEDAVQETFVSAYRALGSFTYGDSHLPWLFRIATNACLKIIRSRRRKGPGPTDGSARIAGVISDPVANVHARRALFALIDELDERDQRILVQHHFAGMDQGQIAESLGISRRAVVKRLTKLRARARALFGEESLDD